MNRLTRSGNSACATNSPSSSNWPDSASDPIGPEKNQVRIDSARGFAFERRLGSETRLPPRPRTEVTEGRLRRCRAASSSAPLLLRPPPDRTARLPPLLAGSALLLTLTRSTRSLLGPDAPPRKTGDGLPVRRPPSTGRAGALVRRRASLPRGGGAARSPRPRANVAADSTNRRPTRDPGTVGAVRGEALASRGSAHWLRASGPALAICHLPAS